MEWNQHSTYSKTFLIWNDFSNDSYFFFWNVMEWNGIHIPFFSCNWWIFFGMHMNQAFWKFLFQKTAFQLQPTSIFIILYVWLHILIYNFTFLCNGTSYWVLPLISDQPKEIDLFDLQEKERKKTCICYYLHLC